MLLLRHLTLKRSCFPVRTCQIQVARVKQSRDAADEQKGNVVQVWKVKSDGDASGWCGSSELGALVRRSAPWRRIDAPCVQSDPQYVISTVLQSGAEYPGAWVWTWTAGTLRQHVPCFYWMYLP